jgi:hypothetical protein
MIDYMSVLGLTAPVHLGLYLTSSLCHITIYRSPVTLQKFQMAPRVTFLIFSGSKIKEPRYACLNEARASHRQRTWAEASSSAPRFLHNGLSISPIKWRCLLRMLCQVRKPVTALDCILLKDKSLALVPRQGPEINSRACSEIDLAELLRHARRHTM